MFYKEFCMKKKVLTEIVVLSLIFSLMLAACKDGDPDPGNQIPAAYKDFYNYPTGRQDNSALLTINNSHNSPVLLFHTDFSPETYIGTVGSLGSIKVRLQDEKFYTIIAVDKADYEERRLQASQFSNLTYYSRTQAFDVKVDSGLTSGSRQWVLNNNTKYWCKVVNVSNPATVYAVLAPNTIRVTLPLNIGDYYDYEPVFLQEIKYQGKVIAMSEFSDRSSGGTTNVDTNPVYTSNFPVTITLTNLKPNVLLINNSGRTVRIYKTKAKQLTNGAVGSDWTLGSGSRALVTGFDAGDKTDDIYLYAVGWTANGQDGFKQVGQNVMTMQINKVYQITVGSEADTFTVEEKNTSEVYDN